MTPNARKSMSLRQQASETRKEGWAEGAATIGGGLLTLGAANTSGKLAGSLKAGAIVAGGSGTIVGTDDKAAGQNDAADAQAHANDASHAKRAADFQNDDIKNDRDLISAAVDFYKQYSETKAQERAAVAHGA